MTSEEKVSKVCDDFQDSRVCEHALTQFDKKPGKKSKRIITANFSLDRETAYCGSIIMTSLRLFGRKFFKKYRFYVGDKDQNSVLIGSDYNDLFKWWQRLQNEIYG